MATDRCRCGGRLVLWRRVFERRGGSPVGRRDLYQCRRCGAERERRFAPFTNGAGWREIDGR